MLFLITRVQVRAGERQWIVFLKHIYAYIYLIKDKLIVAIVILITLTKKEINCTYCQYLVGHTPCGVPPVHGGA